MSTRRSRFEGLFEPQASQAEHPVQEQAEQAAAPLRDTSEEILKERKEETKKPRNQEGIAPRVKTNYEIRQDYVRTMKRIAVDEGRKIYEVMEEAIGQYIERHNAKHE